ncbi:MAG: PaaI family thioesterase [Peptococcaceae bacterium]|nr:PaaI family thioesterase [Peptococcaceae bacterium]
MKQPDRTTNKCFACGPDNPISLRLQFEDDGDVVRTSFTPRDEHQGWPGIMHGGLMATILDEAMAQWCWRRNIPALTGEITVRFKKEVPVGTGLTVEARLEQQKGRLLFLEAEAVLPDGKCAATAKSKFIRMTGEQAGPN